MICCRPAFAVVAMSLAAPLAHADDKYGVADAPDLMAACRLSNPMQCLVPAAPEWQAKYRDRCTETPERCTYRPDGTISTWTSERKFGPSPQLVAAIHAVREQEQARRRHMGPR